MAEQVAVRQQNKGKEQHTTVWIRKTGVAIRRPTPARAVDA
jgi:hypothetical protein